MTRFEKKLPALRLTSRDLVELEKILHSSISENDKIQENIEIRYDGWNRSYNSVKDLLDDPIKPDSIKYIQWRLYVIEKEHKRIKGSIWLHGTYFDLDGNSLELMIEGEDTWVRSLSQRLLEFLSRRRTVIGRIVNNWWFLAILMFLSGYLFSSGIEKIITKTGNIALAVFWLCTAIIIGIFVIIVIIQLSSERQIIPPLLIVFKENHRRKTIEQLIIGVLAGLISGAIISLLLSG
ncbi:hypothetical protein [Thermococcus sp.]